MSICKHCRLPIEPTKNLKHYPWRHVGSGLIDCASVRTEAELSEAVSLTIDWIPPSVNHYKKPVTKSGRLSFVRTDEANAFRDAVALKARGQSVTPVGRAAREIVRYAVYVTVYLGAGQRGDGDNFLKVVCDSLQAAGVIHSDARVRRCCVDVEDCDRGNPRTEIRVERIERRTV